MDKKPEELISEFVAGVLKRNPVFTGKFEVNFKDGILMDINETTRVKFEIKAKFPEKTH